MMLYHMICVCVHTHCTNGSIMVLYDGIIIIQYVSMVLREHGASKPELTILIQAAGALPHSPLWAAGALSHLLMCRRRCHCSQESRSLVGWSVGRWSSVDRSLVGRSVGQSVIGRWSLDGRSVIGRRSYAVGCGRG